MNKNLIKPQEITRILRQFDNNKKQKPESIGGRHVILVFLYEENDERFITKIKMCSEKQVDQLVWNSRNSVQFTHYSVHVCKDKAKQEAIFVSILNKYPSLLSKLPTQNISEWKSEAWTKKHLGITKWDLNKLQFQDEDVSLNYNGVIYWHTPSIEQMTEEIEVL